LIADRKKEHFDKILSSLYYPYSLYPLFSLPAPVSLTLVLVIFKAHLRPVLWLQGTRQTLNLGIMLFF
jgi:hypothetical protein